MSTGTSNWPAGGPDNIPSAGDPAIVPTLVADAVNAIQADLVATGATTAGARVASSPTITTGTAWQNTAKHAVTLSVQVATAGTVEVQLISNAASPVTTTLEAARTVAASGSPNVIVQVPAGWSAKLTATTTVLGTAFVY